MTDSLHSFASRRRAFLAWWSKQLRDALPPGLKSSPFGKRERILAAVAAGTLASAIVLAPFLRASERASLQAEVERLSGPAGQAVELRDALSRLAAPVDASAAALRGPDALEVLRVLTALLPNDVRLSGIDVDARGLRLEGTGRDPKRLVARLRGSARFSHVVLASSSGESFAITAQVAR